MQKIDRIKFFKFYRVTFGKLSQSQVDALNYLIDCFDKSTVITRLSEFAYILATIMHETANTFLPICERGGWNYFKYLIGKLGINNLTEANMYKGRGYVQLTGRINYEKFSNLLGIDLVNKPELAQDKLYAWVILELGMTRGLYTGRKLSDYFGTNYRNFYGARAIINGDVKKNGAMIAGYANDFLNCLEYA